MPATYREVADLLELCRQPVGSDPDCWPTAATWCQNVPARDRNGNPVQSVSADAVSWCAHGRIAAVAHRNGDIGGFGHVAAAACSMLRNAVVNIPGPKKPGWSVSVWNDEPGRTVQQVAALFDRNIAAARQQGDRLVLPITAE